MKQMIGYDVEQKAAERKVNAWKIFLRALTEITLLFRLNIASLNIHVGPTRS